jgi:hypothetical protein
MLGGTHEYAPYIAMQGTFGEYKKRREIDLTVCGRERRQYGKRALGAQMEGEVTHYEFDPEVLTYSAPVMEFSLEKEGAGIRADECLWFEVFCHTRDFGIKEIDERQGAFTETHNTCGVVQLPLGDLLRIHAEGGGRKMVLERPLTDLKIVELKAKEYQSAMGQDPAGVSQAQWEALVERAIKVTHKGVMRFEISFSHFDRTLFTGSVFSSQRPTNLDAHRGRRHKKPAILYTSKQGQETMLHSLENHVLRPYCHNFLKLSAEEKEPLYGPLNENVANLQLPMWISKMGKLPVPCYWSSLDPVTREYASKTERKKDLARYGFNAKTEKCFLRMLHSSLRRHGLSEAKFESVVRHHFSTANKSSTIDPLFLVCEEVMADVGTFAGNSAYYTSDYRFMTEENGKTRTSRMVTLDSWDSTLLNDEGRGDDCEGMDNTAMTIIRAFSWGRQDLGSKWESSLLGAAQLLLSHTVLYDLGATVTSAYVDTNNQKVELKQLDLPMVGDEMDRRSRCDGHCHGLWGSLTDALRRLEAGNVGQDVLGKVRTAAIPSGAANFEARDAQRQVLVLEPTGSIEPRILPVKESYALSTEMCAKKEAERYFLKQLKRGLEERKGLAVKDKSVEDLSEMFNGEGLQHYVEKQDPRRRISSFYNEIVHGSSVDLWKRFDISLSQFAFCTKVSPGKYCYGVKIADFVRGAKDNALICPFYENRETWRTEVLPYIETVQHQLPIMSFGRYTDEKYSRLHSTYNSPSEITSKHKFGPPSSQTMPSEEAAAFEKMAASVSENPKWAMVRLNSRAWKFQQNEKRTQQFLGFISGRKGLVKEGYFTEYQLPVVGGSNAVVEILCIIDVKQCLALEKQATSNK